MSKRFYRDMEIVHYSIVDMNTGNTYPIEDDGVFESICGLLDEQQDTISQLEQENTDLLSDKIRSLDEFEKCTNKLKKKILEQQATIEHLKKRLYDFEKRRIIEESEIDEDVIPKVKLLRVELFGEKYE